MQFYKITDLIECIIFNIHLQDPLVGRVTHIPSSVANDGRLKKLYHVVSNKRKHTSILNDLHKEKLDIQHCKLDKQLTLMELQYSKDVAPVRKSLQELRGTQLYFEKRKHDIRDNRQKHNGMFGSYEDVNKFELRQGVRQLLSAYHPIKKRQKKVGKDMQAGKKDGRLPDTMLLMGKFDDMMNRPWKPIPLPKPKIVRSSKKKGKGLYLPPIAVVTNDKGYGNFFAAGPLKLTLEN